MAHGVMRPHAVGLKEEKTWTAMMFAPLATPLKVPLSPAAIPATWVPCSHWNAGHGAAEPGPGAVVGSAPGQIAVESAVVLEKHACATTRPPKNGWVASTPVSRMATASPAPVKPAAYATGAPIAGTDCA